VNTEGRTTVATRRTSSVVYAAYTNVRGDTAALMVHVSAVLSTLISSVSVSLAGEGHCATLVSS